MIGPSLEREPDGPSPGDLLVRGGRVIDPSQGLDGRRDVLVREGRIAGLLEPGSSLPGGEAGGPPGSRPHELDVSGGLVVPGLVDLHGHWFEGSPFRVDPAANHAGGVTTAVDAGSAGYANFFAFRRQVISRAPIRLLAFVNVAAAGLATTLLPELADLRYARPIETAEVVEANRDVVVGVKVRTGKASGVNSRQTLLAALEAAERAGVPVMAHIETDSPVAWVVLTLRQGDILTHSFTSGSGGLFGPDGRERLMPEVIEARKRGVVFDIGHGCGSFSWGSAERAMAEGFPPDSISTDLHRYSIEGPVFDLPTTMTKFLQLGMALGEVVAAATISPARAIGRAAEIGSLAIGRQADISVLAEDSGEFRLIDSFGTVRTAGRRLRYVHSVLGGRLVDPATHDLRLRPLVASDAEVDCGMPVPVEPPMARLQADG